MMVWSPQFRPAEKGTQTVNLDQDVHANVVQKADNRG